MQSISISGAAAARMSVGEVKNRQKGPVAGVCVHRHPMSVLSDDEGKCVANFLAT